MPINSPDLLLIELNEINFEFVQRYAKAGKLPNLAGLIAKHGITETESESEYDNLEPWIQWVTAHTGKTFAEHKVFRLGDIKDHDILQIWEFLQNNGIKVGAISPMNANNCIAQGAFFVPDPWTDTSVTGGALLSGLSEAVTQAVNDNAQSRLTFRSMFWLLAGAARYARLINYPAYLSLLRKVFKRKSWAKSQFLDLLLSDLTIIETRNKKPQFVTLFLNAGAHIQHHYMFNSAVYTGEQKNPDWLLSEQDDPIFDIYNQYDRTIGQIMRVFPDARLMIATGLHQDPYETEKYYWRLRNHAKCLLWLGVPFKSVEPRMSRDFLIQCRSKEEAANAQVRLEHAQSVDGIPIFSVDNRGDSLFVMLSYPRDIPKDMSIKIGNEFFSDFRKRVSFVAIKNGEHNSIGYLVDTAKSRPIPNSVPLSALPSMIASAFGLDWKKEHPPQIL